MLAAALVVSGGMYLVGRAGAGRVGGTSSDVAGVEARNDLGLDPLSGSSENANDLRAVGDQGRPDESGSRESARVQRAQAACRDIVVPFFGAIQASEWFKCFVEEFQDNNEFQFVGDIIGITDAQLLDFLTHVTLRGTWNAIKETAPKIVEAAPGAIARAWNWTTSNSPLHVASVVFNSVVIDPLTFMQSMVAGTMSNGAEIIAAWNANDGRRAGRAARSIASGAPEALMFLVFDASDYKDMAKLAYHGGGKLAGKLALKNAVPEILEHAGAHAGEKALRNASGHARPVTVIARLATDAPPRSPVRVLANNAVERSPVRPFGENSFANGSNVRVLPGTNAAPSNVVSIGTLAARREREAARETMQRVVNDSPRADVRPRLTVVGPTDTPSPTPIPRNEAGVPAGMCFTAGTQVHTPSGRIAIENVALGARVLTTRGALESATEVDSTWRRIELEMEDPRSADGVLHIAMLRTSTWVEKTHARVGATTDISLPEMDIHGPARIVSIDDAPRIEPGVGRVVLMTVVSQSANVLVLKLRGSDETLEPTFGHRFFSLDRNEWLEAGKLRVGERLRSIHGDAVIASITQKPGTHTVYNFEVEAEHEYLVGTLGVQSHNVHDCGPRPPTHAELMEERLATVSDELGARAARVGGQGHSTEAILRAQGNVQESTALRAALGPLDGDTQVRVATFYADEIARGRIPPDAIRIATSNLDTPVRMRATALYDMDPQVREARRVIRASADQAANAGTSTRAYEAALDHLDHPGLTEALVRYPGVDRGRFIDDYASNAHLGAAEATRRALDSQDLEVQVAFLNRYRNAAPSTASWASGEGGSALPRVVVLENARNALEEAAGRTATSVPIARTRALLDDRAVLEGFDALGDHSRARFVTELANAASSGPDEALHRAVASLSPENQTRFWDAHWLHQQLDETRTALRGAGHGATAELLENTSLRTALGTLDDTTRGRFLNALTEHAGRGADEALARATDAIPSGGRRTFQEQQRIGEELQRAHGHIDRLAAARGADEAGAPFIDALREIESPAFRRALSKMEPASRARFLDAYIENARRGSAEALTEAVRAVSRSTGNGARRLHTGGLRSDLLSVLPPSHLDELANLPPGRQALSAADREFVANGVERARAIINDHPEAAAARRQLDDSLALLDDAAFQEAVAMGGVRTSRTNFLFEFARNAHLGPEAAIERALSTIRQERHAAFAQWLPSNPSVAKIREARESIARAAERAVAEGGSDRLYRQAQAQLGDSAFLDDFARLTPAQQDEYLRVYGNNARLGIVEARRRAFAAVSSDMGKATQARLKRGLCFAAGTEVHTQHGLVTIENIDLGDRVLTTRGAVESPTEVDASWRRIELEMEDPRSANGMLHIALLRPSTWVDAMRARVGALIDIDFEEMRVRGQAHITSIGDAPHVARGLGRVVLSTVESQSADVLVLKLRETDETLEPTFGHRLFSLDRNEWIEAGKLRVGERLRSIHGDATIASIARNPGIHTVYNFEVETEHEYLVGKLGVQSHNNDCAQPLSRDASDPFRPSEREARFQSRLMQALDQLDVRIAEDGAELSRVARTRVDLESNRALQAGIRALDDAEQAVFLRTFVSAAGAGHSRELLAAVTSLSSEGQALFWRAHGTGLSAQFEEVARLFSQQPRFADGLRGALRPLDRVTQGRFLGIFLDGVRQESAEAVRTTSETVRAVFARARETLSERSRERFMQALTDPHGRASAEVGQAARGLREASDALGADARVPNADGGALFRAAMELDQNPPLRAGIAELTDRERDAFLDAYTAAARAPTGSPRAIRDGRMPAFRTAVQSLPVDARHAFWAGHARELDRALDGLVTRYSLTPAQVQSLRAGMFTLDPGEQGLLVWSVHRYGNRGLSYDNALLRAKDALEEPQRFVHGSQRVIPDSPREGMCFTAGTEVHTHDGLVSIENVSLGDRVLTTRGAVHGDTAVDTSWRRIELEMEDPRSADGMLHIAMLRPSTWVNAVRARIGAMIEVDLQEMHVRGLARVTSIGDAPHIEPGIGRVVLMTVQSQSSRVLVLKLRGTDETLEPTFGHRLFSLDRNEWTKAGELRIGERLRATNGEAVIASITQKPGTHTVYNFEVEAEHEYLVGKLGVQSHNDHNCAGRPPERSSPPAPSAPTDEALAAHRGRVHDAVTDTIDALQRPTRDPALQNARRAAGEYLVRSNAANELAYIRDLNELNRLLDDFERLVDAAPNQSPQSLWDSALARDSRRRGFAHHLGVEDADRILGRDPFLVTNEDIARTVDRIRLEPSSVVNGQQSLEASGRAASQLQSNEPLREALRSLTDTDRARALEGYRGAAAGGRTDALSGALSTMSPRGRDAFVSQLLDQVAMRRHLSVAQRNALQRGLSGVTDAGHRAVILARLAEVRAEQFEGMVLHALSAVARTPSHGAFMEAFMDAQRASARLSPPSPARRRPTAPTWGDRVVDAAARIPWVGESVSRALQRTQEWVGGLMRSGKRSEPPVSGGALCFAANTQVHTHDGLVSIETIELGDRVLTTQGAVPAETNVDASWRRIELEMEDPRSADGMLHIAMLRPSTWVDAVRARVGAMIEVNLQEMHVRGLARVTSIGDAPLIEPGVGHVVLMTVQSQSNKVLVLKLRGTDETLEPTFGHRLFSLDRNEWTKAGELRIGERLRAMNGEAVIASITQKPGIHTVYNFEVEAEHEYLVGKLGVQSHNDNPCGATPPGPASRPEPTRTAPTQFGGSELHNRRARTALAFGAQSTDALETLAREETQQARRAFYEQARHRLESPSTVATLASMSPGDNAAVRARYIEEIRTIAQASDGVTIVPGAADVDYAFERASRTVAMRHVDGAAPRTADIDIFGTYVPARAPQIERELLQDETRSALGAWGRNANAESLGVYEDVRELATAYIDSPPVVVALAVLRPGEERAARSAFVREMDTIVQGVMHNPPADARAPRVTRETFDSALDRAISEGMQSPARDVPSAVPADVRVEPQSRRTTNDELSHSIRPPPRTAVEVEIASETNPYAGREWALAKLTEWAPKGRLMPSGYVALPEVIERQRKALKNVLARDDVRDALHHLPYRQRVDFFVNFSGHVDRGKRPMDALRAALHDVDQEADLGPILFPRFYESPGRHAVRTVVEGVANLVERLPSGPWISKQIERLIAVDEPADVIRIRREFDEIAAASGSQRPVIETSGEYFAKVLPTRLDELRAANPEYAHVYELTYKRNAHLGFIEAAEAAETSVASISPLGRRLHDELRDRAAAADMMLRSEIDASHAHVGQLVRRLYQLNARDPASAKRFYDAYVVRARFGPDKARKAAERAAAGLNPEL